MSNTKLSDNLSLKEMVKSATAIRRGLDNSPTDVHISSMRILAVEVFQPLREYFGVPIYISSGYRSQALNEAIGGSKMSQHSKGQAMDIDMDNRNGPSNKEIFDYIIDFLDFDQLIWEFGDSKGPDWVHVSYNPFLPKQRKRVLKAYYVLGSAVYRDIT